MENQKGAARNRLKQVFSFLKALNEHRNPVVRQISDHPWSLWLRDLPQHQAIHFSPDAESEKPLLTIKRAKLTHAPDPPKALLEWLQPGWNDSARDLKVLPALRVDENTTILFSDNEARMELLQSWGFERNKWAREDKLARAAIALFEKFYSLYEQIRKEGEKIELILGNGILAWKRKEGGIRHPILLQRLQLEFEPTVPEFRIVETEHPVELYSALFSSLEDIDGLLLSPFNREVYEKDINPLGNQDTQDFLKRLAIALSAQGQFETDSTRFVPAEFPRIWMDAVLYIRKRSLGFARAIESVIEDLESEDVYISDSLSNIAGIETWSSASSPDGFDPVTDIFKDDILFTKPANIEQMQIAQRLEVSSGVLVQGPPGTGKSHTIANLIGHLLAQGKQILVTSHTTKALRVLRSQLPDELQSLCVSLLESDTEGQQQLQNSVAEITARLQNSNVERLERESKSLEEKRKVLVQEIKTLTAKIKEARNDEYRDLEVLGKRYSPSEAARMVFEQRSKDAWISDLILAGTALPVDVNHIYEAYLANDQITPEDEDELNRPLLDPSSLPDPDLFESTVFRFKSINEKDGVYRKDLWTIPASQGNSQQILELRTQVEMILEQMAEAEKWKQVISLDGKTEVRKKWEELIQRIEKIDQVAKNLEVEVAVQRVKANQRIPLGEQKAIIEEIVHHLKNGSSLGFIARLFHPRWKEFISEVRIAGKPPSTADHFSLLHRIITLELDRIDLREHWHHLMGPINGPDALQAENFPEKFYGNYVPTVKYFLNWFQDYWNPLEEKLESCWFKWQQYLDEQRIKQPQDSLVRLIGPVLTDLPSILNSRSIAIQFDQLKSWFASLEKNLSPFLKSKVVKRIHESYQSLDDGQYRSAYQHLTKLHSLLPLFQSRKDVIHRLSAVAPKWASAIEHRSSPHNESKPPGDVQAAWEWNQLDHELKRRALVDINQLQTKREEKICQLHTLTSELVEKRAWAAQMRRNSLKLQQSLMGWLETVRKIGKGFGKRSAHFRQLASSSMNDCRDAVPVWIMPLARMVEHFFPVRKKFDVVIIDEASQSDVMALLALYLGKKVIVVGDHEQVSPLAVGQQIQVVQNLINQYLEGIPNSQLYDGQMSIYDLARMSFPSLICLLEHFRCMPEIIGFSNSLSYEGKIKPLRESGKVQSLPNTVSYRVGCSYREGDVNPQEAAVVTSLLIACCEQPEYKGKSFGVISLLGEEQAEEIERLLLQKMSPTEYEERKIVCGNAAQFQGDERDIMFISMVDVASDGPLPLKQAKLFQQRFNVAASRAKDQMWVVHSLDTQIDLKPGDLRKKLIEYAEDPSRTETIVEMVSSKAESPLEKEVIRHLVHAGYSIIPQFKIGYYRIDIIVYEGSRRLAIECDGERYHTIENLDQDMARQAVLERLGLNFHRIRGSEFYRNPEAVMQTVFKKLSSMEIEPTGSSSDSLTKNDNRGEGLKARIIARACELRSQWGIAVEGDELKNSESSPPKEANEFLELENFQLEEETLSVQEEPLKYERSELKLPEYSPGDSFEAWISEIGKEVWFAMAHWAKKNNKLYPKARGFLYQVGVRVTSGKPLTERQQKWARDLHRELLELGFRAEE